VSGLGLGLGIGIGTGLGTGVVKFSGSAELLCSDGPESKTTKFKRVQTKQSSYIYCETRGWRTRKGTDGERFRFQPQCYNLVAM